LNWIQTSLQIVKRFGKRKGISKSDSVMGQNPAHPGASPAHPLSFSFPRSTQSTSLPLSRLRPSAAQWPAEAASDSSSSRRPGRAELTTRQPKIHHAPTETGFKLQLEIASGPSSCCARSGSKTPINRSIPCPRIEVFITRP
jgi:hypothetical protein